MGDQAPTVRIRLLGGFAVASLTGEPSTGWRLRKAKTLIKLVALAPGRRMHRDALVELLWPDADPAAATNNLHQAVHAARRALGAGHDVLTVADEVVELSPRLVAVDVDDFDAAAARALRSGTVDDLRAAADLYAGDLLPEDAFEDWAALARERLAETFAAVVVELSRALAGTGRAEEAVGLLRRVVDRRGTDETAVAALMAALHACGRRWEALSAYETLRKRLDAELAAEPAVATRELYQRLLGAESGGAQNSLPAPLSSFVGRTRALGELDRLLRHARLLTLTGPGGAGKTRLAIEAARRAAALPDAGEVRFCALADVRDGDLVLSTAAAALDVVLVGAEPGVDHLADQLRHRRLLLVLDNCEHLRPAVVRLVGALLTACPDLRVLATSREPLGMPAEVNWRVPSLELPGTAVGPEADGFDQLARWESVQLFVERAAQAVPGWRLTPQNAERVVAICNRLDGIPLAIELAAARLAHLSAGDIAERLDDALSLLSHDAPARLDRQQTLRATLDWSHHLLDDVERRLFRRLSVFAGGFDLAAAEGVCPGGADEPPVLPVLSRLVDKSLVLAETSTEPTRFKMHEVVRQYAAERLADAGEDQIVAARHCDWFAAAAAAHDPAQTTLTVPAARWAARERDNLRAALATALARDPNRALDIATRLWRWWMLPGLFAEGYRWLEHALAAAAVEPSRRAPALVGCAVLDTRMSRIARMRDYADELRGAETAGGGLLHRYHAALIDWVSGDWGGAAVAADELLGLATRPADQARVSHLLSLIALGRCDYDEALQWCQATEQHLAEVPADTPPFFPPATVGYAVDLRGPIPTVAFEETIFLGRHVGRSAAVGYVRYTRAWTLREMGRLDDAADAGAAAVDGFRSAGDDDGEAIALARVGNTHRAAGDLSAARAALQASLRLRREIGDLRGIGLCETGLALVDAGAGDVTGAHGRIAVAADLLGRSGDLAGWSATHSITAAIEILRSDLPAATEAAARAAAAQVQLGPGAQRGITWHKVVHAACLVALGRGAEAQQPIGLARGELRALGSRRCSDYLDAIAKRAQSPSA